MLREELAILGCVCVCFRHIKSDRYLVTAFAGSSDWTNLGGGGAYM